MLQTGFPPELTLLAISRLPLTSIVALRRTCSAWNRFICQNINTVYRNAAFTEGFIAKRDASLSELASDPSGGYANSEGPFSSKSIQGVNDWEDLCKRYKEIRRSWLGHGLSRLVSSPQNIPFANQFNAQTRDHHKRIHRFKVDEQRGLLLATTKRGGLFVRDLDTDEVLWELPQTYVHGNAFLEYERGYLVFDRTDGRMEVWRRTEDLQAEVALSRSAPAARDNDAILQPSPAQRDALRVLEEASPPSTSPKAAAACFSPVCILSLPTPPGGYLPDNVRLRFSLRFPSLLVVRFKTAYLIDITTGQVTQTIDNIHRVHRVDVPEVGSEMDEEVPRTSEDAQLNTPASNGPSSENTQDHEDDDDNVSDSDDVQDAIHDQLSLDVRASRVLVCTDLSPRHVLIVWRNELLVFSRKTGLCVLKMDSRKTQYGKWRWDMTPLYKKVDGAENADAAPEKDSYRGAREEGREVVPMPVQLTVESETPNASGRKLYDRFVSSQFSRDGRHLAVLLSGSRLIVVRDFEAVLARHRLPPPKMDDFIDMYLRLAAQIPNPNPVQANNEIVTQMNREERMARQARDRDLFVNTLEVQLGSPRKSYGMHLAYAHGRIGVVTSNAVYVVTLPTYLLDDTTTSDLKVVRVPHFVNPSWLGGVGSLVLTDVGLYLNWNSRCHISVPRRGGGVDMTGSGPTLAYAAGARASYHIVQYVPWVVENNTQGWFFPDRDEQGTIPPDDVPAAGGHPHQAAGEGGDGLQAMVRVETPEGDSTDEEADVGAEVVGGQALTHDISEKYRRAWERDYLRDLRELNTQNMDELYQPLPDRQGWIVAHFSRCLELPQESTVHAVEFAPKVPSPSITVFRD